MDGVRAMEAAPLPMAEPVQTVEVMRNDPYPGSDYLNPNRSAEARPIAGYPHWQE